MQFLIRSRPILGTPLPGIVGGVNVQFAHNNHGGESSEASGIILC